jgi:hypothetical protein
MTAGNPAPGFGLRSLRGAGGLAARRIGTSPAACGHVLLAERRVGHGMVEDSIGRADAAAF